MILTTLLRAVELDSDEDPKDSFPSGLHIWGGRHFRLDANVVEIDGADAGEGQGCGDQAGVGDGGVERELPPTRGAGEADAEGLAAGAIVKKSAVGTGLDRRRNSHPAADLHQRSGRQPNGRRVNSEESS